MVISCGPSAKEKERNEKAKQFNEMIEREANRQFETGQGRRYRTIEEAARSMEAEKRVNQAQYTTTCPDCGGTGKFYDAQLDNRYTCPICGGTGRIPIYINN